MMQTTKLSESVIVRDADIQDIVDLAPNMRQSDRKEIWVSRHRTPKSALSSGFTESILCFTVEAKGNPIAMFGMVAKTILGKTASVWLLASPELEKIQRILVKHSRHFIDIMLEYYPILSNYVDVENRASIRWLRWSGAKFGPVVPYGVEQQPFQYFEFRRSDK